MSKKTKKTTSVNTYILSEHLPPNTLTRLTHNLKLPREIV